MKEGRALASDKALEAEVPIVVAVLGAIEVMDGRREAASRLLNLLLRRRKTEYVCAHEIAILQTALGMKREALQSLQIAYGERSDCMPFLHLDPILKPLAREPEFEALLAKVANEH